MLQVSGHNPLKSTQKSTKINEIFKTTSFQPKPAPLSKPEIFQALDIPLSELNIRTSDSNQLLTRIEQEANKIHESLKKLKRKSTSPRKNHNTSFSHSEHNISEEEKEKYFENYENDKESSNHYEDHHQPIDAYDSDPEYQRYQSSSEAYKPIKAFSEERNHDNSINRDSRSPLDRIDYKEYANHEASNEKTLSFTIPKPFRFESREINKPTAISKRRFLEDINERKTLEKSIRNFQFKATAIPEHIKDRFLFSKIMRKQEQKRVEVKKNSKILTLQREKPFSFYLRDNKISKKSAAERKIFKFQANPIPWFCSVPLLQIMQEKGEAERRERVAKEAQYLMNISHLPSRMEKHEQEKKIKELKGLEEEIEIGPKKMYSFQPEKRRPVPEFAKLQANFQRLLDRKRSNKRPIIPKPFDFTSSKRAQKREYLDQENMKTKEAINIQKKSVYIAKMPEVQPPSTKKWEQAYEMNKKKQEMDAKKIIEEQKRIEEKEKKRKEIEIRVKASPAIVDNRKELEEKKKKTIEGKKREIKTTEEQYRKTLEEINDRVRKRLLLVENYEEGSRKARKRKLMEKKI